MKPLGAKKSRILTILALVLPIEILFFFITIFPFILQIYLSFTPWQPGFGDWWTSSIHGFKNYISLFTKDVRFLISIGRTVLMLIVAVSAEFVLGLILAHLFTKAFPAKKVLLPIFLLPMMLIPVVVGYDFFLMFQPGGPINGIISFITNSNFRFNWLADPDAAFFAVIITDIWHWTPFLFLLLYSGLLALPETPIKAAKVLGASNWQIFWRVKIPMLKRILLVAVVIRAMEFAKLFDELYVLTKGGPGFATETMSYYIYVSTTWYHKIGYTSAAAIIVLILTLIPVSLGFRRVLRLE